MVETDWELAETLHFSKAMGSFVTIFENYDLGTYRIFFRFILDFDV